VLDVLRSRTAHTGVRRLSSPGSRPITLVWRLTSPSDPFEQVCAAPPAAVPGRVAEVHDERVEVVGEALAAAV
jgi:hypothetical protein